MDEGICIRHHFIRYTCRQFFSDIFGSGSKNVRINEGDGQQRDEAQKPSKPLPAPSSKLPAILRLPQKPLSVIRLPFTVFHIR